MTVDVTPALEIDAGHPWLRPGRRAAVLDAVRSQHELAPRDSTGCLVLPIDVEALAAEAGLRVIRVEGLAGERTRNLDGTPLSGLMDFGRGRIYVEQRNSPQRQRFTIAHELAHWLLGHRALFGDVHSDAKIDYWRGSIDTDLTAAERAEHEANRFAGLVLIPPGELDAHVAELGTDVVELARRFGVSAPAMRVHLSRYLHPAMRTERFA